VESNVGSETGDLLAILGVDVCEDVVLSWWDLIWQIDILGQLQITLLQRAFQVNILNLFAEICFLVDESDDAVFDLDMDFGAVFNVF